uniref:EF-hand domain-containing protein n=1 Tax=Tetraselmis sp. GSL018 TaxID=582737 RepID=A0A061RNR6_9CHLO
MRKLGLFQFLFNLSAEFKRLENEMVENLPPLFKAWDADCSGKLSRTQFQEMAQDIGASPEESAEMWSICQQLHRAKAPDESEPPDGPEAIDYDAFEAGAKRTQMVRRYMRLHRSTPAPAEMDEAAKDAHNKMLHLVVENLWTELKGMVDTVLAMPFMKDEESSIQSQMVRIKNGDDGEHRVLALIGLMKNLTNVKIEHVAKMCKYRDVNSPASAEGPFWLACFAGRRLQDFPRHVGKQSPHGEKVPSHAVLDREGQDICSLQVTCKCPCFQCNQIADQHAKVAAEPSGVESG